MFCFCQRGWNIILPFWWQLHSSSSQSSNLSSEASVVSRTGSVTVGEVSSSAGMFRLRVEMFWEDVRQRSRVTPTNRLSRLAIFPHFTVVMLVSSELDFHTFSIKFSPAAIVAINVKSIRITISNLLILLTKGGSLQKRENHKKVSWVDFMLFYNREGFPL